MKPDNYCIIGCGVNTKGKKYGTNLFDLDCNTLEAGVASSWFLDEEQVVEKDYIGFRNDKIIQLRSC